MTATVLGALLGGAVGALLGSGLAWLGWYAWVWGALGLLGGLGCAWVALSYSLWQGLTRKRAFALGCVGLVAAFLAFELREDVHQRRAFAQSYARAQAAASGLDMATIAGRFDESTYAFLAKDADRLLDEEVVRLGHAPNEVGRFFYRREVGVRLGGPFTGGRGLELGLVGGILAWLAEFSLGLFVLWRVCRPRPSLDPNSEQG